MNCEKCGAPLEGEEQICPVCAGEEAAAEVTEEPIAAEEPVCEETAEEPAEEVSEEETAEGGETAEGEEAPAEEAPAEEAPAEEAPKKKGKGGLIALIAVLVLAVGAVAFWLAGGFDLFAGETPDSFIHEAEYFTEKELDRTIARCGSSTLTNRKLTYYYWTGFYTLVSSYGDYFTYLLSDPTARLDTVTIPDGTTTWDQTLMESALENYNVMAAAAQEAKKNDFVLPENKQASLTMLESTLTSYAETYGFESPDDYLQQSYGPYANLADYREYLEEYYLAMAWLAEVQENVEVTHEEIAAFYEAHAEDYRAEGIHNNGPKMVNVRHILITPEATELTEEDEGYDEAVAAARALAKEYAESVYAQWETTDMTEETFAELASTYTTDPGSMGNGGLYEDVYAGQTVPTFNDWCFDESRQPGDTGIVETDYGYHIMYFVGQSEYAQWESLVLEDVLSEKYSEELEALKEAYPIKTKLTYAAVYPCNTEIE